MLALVAAYVIGAVPIGYLVGRAFGLGDIRRHGSGNIGATNVLRTVGRGPALLTLAGDILKGYAAVVSASLIGGGDPTVMGAGAVAAVVGNCWSVFLRFRGGKGVATGLGALLRLVPAATVVGALVWLLVSAGFRYASLASLAAVVAIPVAAALLGNAWTAVAASSCIAVIIIARHHQNIGRLLAGTESRLGKRSAST
jgi:acyl phosphate:glycerol-3-phosphate acyltransferase